MRAVSCSLAASDSAGSPSREVADGLAQHELVAALGVERLGPGRAPVTGVQRVDPGQQGGRAVERVEPGAR